MSQMSRLVLMFPGFEPIPIEAHCRRFVREAAKTAPVYGMTIEPSAFAAEDAVADQHRHRQLHGGCRRRGLVGRRPRWSSTGLASSTRTMPRATRSAAPSAGWRRLSISSSAEPSSAISRSAGARVLLHLSVARADRRGARGMGRLSGRGSTGCRRAGAGRLGRGAVRLPAGARLRGKTAAFPAGHGRLGVRARSGARSQARASTGASPCCRPTCAGASGKPPPARSCSPRIVLARSPR